MQLMGMDKLFHLEGGRDAKRTIINAISLLYSMYAGQTTQNHIPGSSMPSGIMYIIVFINSWSF